MGDSPVVSVIMATYNHAKYLRRSIGSVLAQTYPNWELIIWDDGSTDNTREIIESYKDDRIYYHYDKNHGVSYARNQAIKFSGGKYLAILDSDDEWLDEKLAAQVEVMDAYPRVNILFSDFMNIDLDTNENQLGFDQCQNGIHLLDVEKIGDHLFFIKGGMPESLTVSNFVLPSTVMITRRVFEDYSFLENLRNSADFVLWWQMCLNSIDFAYFTNIYTIRYKPHGSLSSPNILTYENKIRGLDYCLQETLARDRNDLIPFLNHGYLRAWQNLIPLYGDNGDRKRMFKSFFQSVRYGGNLSSIRLLFESIK